MRRPVRRHLAVTAAAVLLLAGCGADDEPDPLDEPDAAEEEDEPDEDEPDDVDEPDEDADLDEASDVEGEEPGVVLLSDPITFEEGGLELEVDAVRIISVAELEDISGEEITDYLDDQSAVTMVGLRVTMRNTTDNVVEWFPAGSGSAIVLEGQQGAPSFLGDWGDTLRANAELEINAYYESRVDVDDARAAGEFIWDVGQAHDDETFDTITDPELTITYSY